jgi:L-threonylcarbamoyladenylate synthase
LDAHPPRPDLPFPFPDVVDALARELLAGGCVAIPTDTVYGLAAALSSPDAVARLAELKGRPASMPIALLVADVDQAAAVAVLDDTARALADRHWPGPLTLVVDGVDGVGPIVGTDDGSVGVRCPDHALVRALAATVGPIATTSANRHRAAPATTAEEVAAQFPSLPLIADGGACAGVPSTVVDVRVTPPAILRQGSLHVA